MSDQPRFRLSEHARHAIAERRIRNEWIVQALTEPRRLEIDAVDPALRHALRPIEAFGDRVLRVVYNPQTEPWVVVTAYFDRSMKGRL